MEDVKASASWEATHAFNKEALEDPTSKPGVYVPKLYSLLILIYILVSYLLVVCLFVYVCVYVWNIENNVWFKCGGGGVNKVFSCKIRGFLSPITSNVVFTVFKCF